MELIVILLSSISGALIGTSVGIYLLYRKLRPITGAELDLTRGKLRSTEFSLATVTANAESLKKQVEEREQQLAASDAKVRELEAATATIRQQLVEEESKIKGDSLAALDTANRQITALEAQGETDRRQSTELAGQVARLTTELQLLREHFNEESTGRSSLETQLTTEHEHSRRLASRVAELEAERSHFDLTMQEERQSAAKGIELLLMAQENLTRVFRQQQPSPQVPVESNGHSLVAVAAGAGSPNE